jgi:hypothetical protein
MRDKYWDPKRQYQIETGKSATVKEVIEEKEYCFFNV